MSISSMRKLYAHVMFVHVCDQEEGACALVYACLYVHMCECGAGLCVDVCACLYVREYEYGRDICTYVMFVLMYVCSMCVWWKCIHTYVCMFVCKCV